MYQEINNGRTKHSSCYFNNQKNSGTTKFWVNNLERIYSMDSTALIKTMLAKFNERQRAQWILKASQTIRAKLAALLDQLKQEIITKNDQRLAYDYHAVSTSLETFNNMMVKFGLHDTAIDLSKERDEFMAMIKQMPAPARAAQPAHDNGRAQAATPTFVQAFVEQQQAIAQNTLNLAQDIEAELNDEKPNWFNIDILMESILADYQTVQYDRKDTTALLRLIGELNHKIEHARKSSAGERNQQAQPQNNGGAAAAPQQEAQQLDIPGGDTASLAAAIEDELDKPEADKSVIDAMLCIIQQNMQESEMLDEDVTHEVALFHALTKKVNERFQ
jgi:hypothetical protein